MPSRDAPVLALATALWLAPAAASAQATAPDCSTEVRVLQVRPLDFGTLALPQRRRQDVQHTLSPEGMGYPAPEVLHRRRGAPAELLLCGPPQARFALELPMARAPLRAEDTGSTSHGVLSHFRVSAEGCRLQRMAWDTWECELGPSGRATLRIGATLTLPSQTELGTLRTELPFNLRPR
jgi:hypothetical protein